MGYANALGVNSPSFATTDLNYSAANYIGSSALTQSLGLYKDQVDKDLIHRYGLDDFTGWMEMAGGARLNPIERREYSHYEKDFTNGTINVATSTLGAANGLITFTLAADGKSAISYTLSPQTATTTFPTVMPRPYDILQLGAGRRQIQVTSVNKSGGTFVGYMLDGLGLAAIAVDTPLIVVGTAQKEASTRVDSRVSRVFTYKNSVQTHRDDWSTSMTAMGEKTWMSNLTDHKGNTGSAWYYENLGDSYRNYRSQLSMIFMDSEINVNTGLANLAGFETVSKTEGAIRTIEAAGTSVPYTSGALTLANVDSMNDSFLKYKGDKQNIVIAGHDFVKDFNALNRNGDGTDWGKANSPGRYDFSIRTGVKKALDLDFEEITYNTFTYMLKPFNIFSDPTAFGATGQEYQKLGVVMPMGDTVTYNDNSVNSSSAKVPSMRINYKSNPNRWMQETVSGINHGSTIDEETVTCITEAGLEMFAVNRMGIFK